MHTPHQSAVYPSECTPAPDSPGWPDPLRGRLNAAFFAMIDGYMHCKYRT